MIIAGFFAMLFANFALCTRIPFEEYEALSKRQSSNHSTGGITLPVYFCKPTPVAVEVPPPSAWPTHVELWRCMGSAFSPGILECAASKEAPFLLNVFLHPSFIPGTVPMTNHTACDQVCIVKEKDCNNATHILDPKSCRCVCRSNLNCGLGRTWNRNDCKCKCNQIAPCTGYEAIKKWNDESCKCECQDKVVKKCQSQKKYLKPDTCKCVCPAKTCPKGEVVDQKDCKCTKSV